MSTFKFSATLIADYRNNVAERDQLVYKLAGEWVNASQGGWKKFSRCIREEHKLPLSTTSGQSLFASVKSGVGLEDALEKAEQARQEVYKKAEAAKAAAEAAKAAAEAAKAAAEAAAEAEEPEAEEPEAAEAAEAAEAEEPEADNADLKTRLLNLVKSARDHKLTKAKLLKAIEKIAEEL